jgi:hypothetical protein
MEPLPALPKPTNSGSSRPNPIKPWCHNPHPDPSAWWCPVCKSHTEYKPVEFEGPTYSSYDTAGSDGVGTSWKVSGSRIYTKAICQRCNTIPPIMKGGPQHLGELYHLGRYEPDWEGMFIPKDQKPKSPVLSLAILTIVFTAIIYHLSKFSETGRLPLKFIFYISISIFLIFLVLWFLGKLSKLKKWWAWGKWAKQQGGQTSVAKLESAAAPTSEPAQQQPETNKEELGHLSPELKNVLELCTLYLVALDEQFTPIGQGWVDSKFGPGTSQRFIQTMGTMDWENCFADIYQQIIQLPPTDQLYLKSSAVPLFQGLMESDGLEGIEQERLDHLMRYIRESLGNA